MRKKTFFAHTYIHFFCKKKKKLSLKRKILKNCKHTNCDYYNFSLVLFWKDKFSKKYNKQASRLNCNIVANIVDRTIDIST